MFAAYRGKWTRSLHLGASWPSDSSSGDYPLRLLRLLGREKDPLDQSLLGWRRPYVKCSRRFLFFGERRWRVTREVDLAEYLGGASDELVALRARTE